MLDLVRLVALARPVHAPLSQVRALPSVQPVRPARARAPLLEVPPPVVRPVPPVPRREWPRCVPHYRVAPAVLPPPVSPGRVPRSVAVPLLRRVVLRWAAVLGRRLLVPPVARLVVPG